MLFKTDFVKADHAIEKVALNSLDFL